jgi:hypothetical protein
VRAAGKFEVEPVFSNSLAVIPLIKDDPEASFGEVSVVPYPMTQKVSGSGGSDHFLQKQSDTAAVPREVRFR